MKAKQFDTEFNKGKSIIKYLDLSKAKRGGQEIKRINVDFPVWMLNSLDKEASRRGVSRQSVVKHLVAKHFHAVS
jgi:hypothetical protein